MSPDSLIDVMTVTPLLSHPNSKRRYKTVYTAQCAQLTQGNSSEPQEWPSTSPPTPPSSYVNPHVTHSPPKDRELTSVVAPAGAQAHGQAEQFTKGKLVRSDLDPASPIPQFHSWFSQAQAQAALVPHPEACALSTAELPSGRVSSRMVYLKELDARGGFVVYSNWGTSRKAADVKSNPNVALVFYWEALQRQVRVEGEAATRHTQEESRAYFDTRARGSRIGAWASRQSAVLEPGGEGDDGRAQLEGWVKEVEERFEGKEDIPVPEFWGGMRIVPRRVEFWQGRDSRLHDRFAYEWEEDTDGGRWRLDRLSP